jgi:hypothetical protein
VHDDDDILQAHEAEFDDALNRGEPVARSNRGFWLVTGSISLVCVLMVVAIFANRSLGNDIGTAQHDIAVAQAGAMRVYTETGSFQGADASGLTQGRYDDGELTYVAGDVAATAVRTVSVTATASMWAVAVQIRSGACFYLRLNAGATDPLYGEGTRCTGEQAVSAKDGEW